MAARIGVDSGCLAGWTVVLSALHGWWVRAFVLSEPPPWDHALYLYLSLRFRHALADGGLTGLAHDLLHRSATVAPLFPLASVPLYLTLGDSRAVAYLTLSPFLLLLLLGVYLLAREPSDRAPAFAKASAWPRRSSTSAGGQGEPETSPGAGGAALSPSGDGPPPSPKGMTTRELIEEPGLSSAGLLAVFVVSTFTGVVNFSREYMMDLPSVAVATLGLYFLWRSDGLTRYRWALAAGAGLGLSLLTKVMSGYLFLGPLALAVVARQSRAALVGLGLLLLGAALVAAPWFGPHLAEVARYMTYFGFGEGSRPYRAGGPAIASFGNFCYYGFVLVGEGTGPFFAAMVALPLLALALFRRRRSASPLDRFLLVWLFSGYTILTLVPNKGGERYALGLLPPLAILAARAAMKSRLKALVVAVGILNLALLTWPSPLAGPAHAHFDGFPHLGKLVRGRWPVDEALEALATSFRTARPPVDAASDADYVREVYRALLRREPDQNGLAAYLGGLQSGALTRRALYEAIASSEEFRSRPLQILVVPDHRVVNASTLNYLAEAERLPLRFVHFGRARDFTERRWAFDAALVKDGGEQGPPHEVGGVDEIQQALRDQSAPRGTWVCPDGSLLLLLSLTPPRAPSPPG